MSASEYRSPDSDKSNGTTLDNSFSDYSMLYSTALETPESKCQRKLNETFTIEAQSPASTICEEDENETLEQSVLIVSPPKRKSKIPTAKFLQGAANGVEESRQSSSRKSEEVPCSRIPRLEKY